MQGRGGMGAKVDAALSAIHGGVQAVIIAAGTDSGVIGHIMTGDKVGTIFIANPEKRDESEVTIGAISEGLVLNVDSSSADMLNGSPAPEQTGSAEEVASGARASSRLLQALTTEQRIAILLNMAHALEKHQEDILAANLMDIEAAEKR